VWAVELRREKSRCRLQDGVRTLELTVLLLQRLDPFRLAGRGPGVSPLSISACRTQVLTDSTP
jgi:hypothetical protein